MASLPKAKSASVLKFLLLLLWVAFVEQARGDAVVTGTVFCDQCKDGQRSLFDYPLSGFKVRVSCDSMEKEETTNWFGSYTVTFEGTPDLSGCSVHLLGPQQGSSSCGAAAGPAQQLRLLFRMFNMEMYTADSLLSQPAQPMSPICPRSNNPPTGTPKPTPPSPPRVTPPPTRVYNPPTGTPMLPSPPRVTFPPTPFFQASACPHEIWTRPEYRCHWTLVQPDTKVAVAFGLIVARRYGTDISLWQGIQGRGDIYRTLLREATTALLNSYNSVQFKYPTLDVLNRMNLAVMGTSRQALLTALRFKRANSGYGNSTRCNLTPCTK